ncbi:MAG: hypothetical protein WC477_06745 [Patescibacteria group bacterium]
MLIVCSGKDSFRALERARFYENGYKKKYDANGSSVDHLPSGKEGIDRLLSLGASASLFSSRRFVRVDGIITTCPKDKRKALIASLSRDPEMTIVVTIEEDELTKKDLAGFDAIPSFLHEAFGQQSPAQFLKWATSFAQQFSPVNTNMIRAVAQAVQYDSWAFSTEYPKMAAGGASNKIEEELNVFGVVDAILSRNKDRKHLIKTFDDANAILPSAVSQSRSFVSVKDGFMNGVHPYVAQKLSRVSSSHPAERFRAMISALLFSRTGLCDAEEAMDVFG